jgi:hypothetical protein
LAQATIEDWTAVARSDASWVKLRKSSRLPSSEAASIFELRAITLIS